MWGQFEARLTAAGKGVSKFHVIHTHQATLYSPPRITENMDF